MSPELRNILVVDDESAMRHMLGLVLEKEGYRVTEADSGEAALAELEQENFDLVLCDLRMPGMGGLAFLEESIRRKIGATFIMMSAYGSIDKAVECMKIGAYDYISKPFKPDEVALTLRKAEERLRLRRENLELRERLARREGERQIVFQSAAMAKVDELIDRVADSSSSVLITGETGTGKELVARALHARSSRSSRPFCAINCSAIAPHLMESELFGHAKGSFTGAHRDRPGLFGAADGGVLFLDEIGELSLELQPKLLRVLQEGEVRSVGETWPRRVDVRVVAATARDLEQEIAQGRFRDDLFYRLAVIELRVPALRERPEDIPVLAEHFLHRIAAREGRQVPVMMPEAITVLLEYLWPGNIRELENFLEKTMIFCRGNIIGLADLPWETRRQKRGYDQGLSLKAASRRLEEEYIRKALAATGGNRTRAAQILEISLRGLLYKMKEYGIE